MIKFKLRAGAILNFKETIMNNTNVENIFSTYTLNILNDCKRCFWIHFNRKLERPNKLTYPPPVGMMSKIKDYFDKHRGTLPKELVGKVKGVLVPDQSLINKWRGWGKDSLTYIDEKYNAKISGALDDCIVEDGKHSPVIYDVKGSYPEKDIKREKYHQVQMDILSYLLQVHNYPVRGVGYLVYYIPEKVEDKELVKFNVETIEMSAKPDNARALIIEAMSILLRAIPAASKDCELCSYVSNFEAAYV